ncbi:MAG TPA: alpha-1,4-glucan--maltose-1-phosphate maltosyltransferase [Actinomycetota bacterium]|jgi:starch synthase (maltosyl-transferring)
MAKDQGTIPPAAASNQPSTTGHMVIQRISPQIDCGRYRAKAIAGDRVDVGADILRDGPDLLRAVIRYRGPGETKWSEAPMDPTENDRWEGWFRPSTVGPWRYCVEAWTDDFGTWRRDLSRKAVAGQKVDLELEEGALLIESRLDGMSAEAKTSAIAWATKLRAKTRKRPDPRVIAALDDDLLVLMNAHPDRTGSTTSDVLELTVERERARFGAWYEFFPRSSGTKTKHGTLKDSHKTLRYAADMGFDVVYLPPIHPIGTAFRKGKNNKLKAGPKDVGSPWAIGAAEGGHKDVHPDLGTIEDFDELVAEAERLGIEICLDFAIQCSPDHPWVTDHPEWFNHRPDGTIKYAENPPKKYQDIYPINFDTPDRQGLWDELKSIVDFWIGHGVKIFRVDNPHTKSFAFWEWMIDGVHREHPDVIFLAEAFTRPKVMQTLAKLGFTQSYTYFTWRNYKWEIEEYLTELTRTEMAHYFRPNFFANTPDILHEYLQAGGPPAFKIRLVLASMLSPTYGIYSGFELFENVPVKEGSEEYLNSEKFELRPRSVKGKPNLVPYITRINDVRKKHPALSELTNLHFHQTDKDAIIAFSKTSPGEAPILVVVNLNPWHWEEATVELDLDVLGLDPSDPFEVHDLITDTTFVWRGAWNYVRLDPQEEPAHIFRIGR